MAVLNNPPVLFCRYIDDVLMIFHTKQAAEACLSAMRCINVNIKVGEFLIGPRVHFLDLDIEVHPRHRATLVNSCFATRVFRKPCDLQVILHMQSAHEYAVKFGTVFSQMVRIWRLCSDKRDACQEIANFLHCMMALRGLRPRTTRKLTNKLLAWVCTNLIKADSDSCRPVTSEHHAVNRVARHFVNLPCMLPGELSRQRMNCVFRYITDRFTNTERAHVGEIRFRNITSSRLSQLFT